MTDIVHSDSTIPTLIIRPPKKWVPVDFRELLRIPGTALQFCLPRREDPVQTDLPWLSLGDHPTALYDGDLHPLLRRVFLKIPSDGVLYPLLSYAALISTDALC
ncbi:MAG: hypothetical protein Q7U51_16110 [Methanoregula sp.]|nr:hypothetical protein [Methanoregula sp.]